MRGEKAATSSSSSSSSLLRFRNLSPPPVRRHDDIDEEEEEVIDDSPISPSRKMKESLVNRVNKTRQYRHWAALTVQLGMEDNGGAAVVTDNTSMKSVSESSSKSAESRQERIAEKRTALAKAQQYQRSHTPTREVQPSVSPAKHRHSQKTPSSAAAAAAAISTATTTNTALAIANLSNDRRYQPTVSPGRLRGLKGVAAVAASTNTASMNAAPNKTTTVTPKKTRTATPNKTMTTGSTTPAAPAAISTTAVATAPPAPAVSPRLRTYRSFPVDMIKQVDTSVLERKVGKNENAPKSPRAEIKPKVSTSTTTPTTTNHNNATATAPAAAKQEYSLSVFKQKRALAVFQESVKNSPERKAKLEAKVQQGGKAPPDSTLSQKKQPSHTNPTKTSAQQEKAVEHQSQGNKKLGGEPTLIKQSPATFKQKSSWNKPDHALVSQSPPPPAQLQNSNQPSAMKINSQESQQGPDDEMANSERHVGVTPAVVVKKPIGETTTPLRVKSPLRSWNRPEHHALKRAVSPLYQRRWNNHHPSHSVAPENTKKSEADVNKGEEKQQQEQQQLLPRQEEDVEEETVAVENTKKAVPTLTTWTPSKLQLDRNQLAKTPPPPASSERAFSASRSRKSPTAERYRLAKNRQNMNATTSPTPMRIDIADQPVLSKSQQHNEQDRLGIETPDKVSVSSMKERFGGTLVKKTPASAVRPSPIRFRRTVEPASAPPKLRSITPTPPEDRAISPSDTDIILDVQESESDEGAANAIIETPDKISVADMKSRFGSKPNVINKVRTLRKNLPRQNSSPKIHRVAAKANTELELYSSKSADDRPTRILYDNPEEYPDPPLEQMSDISEENRLIIETPDKVSVNNMRARFNPNPAPVQTKKWQKPVSVATANTMSRTAGRYRAASPPLPTLAVGRGEAMEETRAQQESTGVVVEDARVTIETPDKVSVSSIKDMFMNNNSRSKPGLHPSRRTATPVSVVNSGRTPTPSTPPHGLRSGSRVDVATPKAPSVPQRIAETETGPEMPELESSQSPGPRHVNTAAATQTAKQVWQNGVLKRELASNNNNTTSTTTSKPRWTPTSPQPTVPRKFGATTNSAERKTPAVWKRISPSIAGMLDGADAELLNREFAAQAVNGEHDVNMTTPGKDDAITRMEKKLQRRDRQLVPPDSPFGSSYMMDMSVDTSPAQPHHQEQSRYSGNVNMTSLPEEEEPAAAHGLDPGYETPPPDPAEFVEVETEDSDEQQKKLQEDTQGLEITTATTPTNSGTPRSRHLRPWQTDLETTSPRSWNMIMDKQPPQPFDDGSASRADSRSTQQTPIHKNAAVQQQQQQRTLSSLDRYAEEKKVDNDTLSVHSLRKMAADSIHAVDFDNAIVNGTNNDPMMMYQLEEDDNSQNSSLFGGEGNSIPKELPPEVAKALSWTNEDLPVTSTATYNNYHHKSTGKSGAELDLALSESDSDGGMMPPMETDRVALLEPSKQKQQQRGGGGGASAVLRFWAETTKEEKEAVEEWKDRDPSVVDLDETDVVDNTYDAALTNKLLRNASQGDDIVRSVRSWRSQATPKSSNEPRELDPFSLEDAPSWGQVVLKQTRNETIFDPFATNTFEENLDDFFSSTADPFSTSSPAEHQRPPRKSNKFSIYPPGNERSVPVPRLPPSDRDNAKYSHGIGEDYSVSKLSVGGAGGRGGSVHSSPWSYDADDSYDNTNNKNNNGGEDDDGEI